MTHEILAVGPVGRPQDGDVAGLRRARVRRTDDLEAAKRALAERRFDCVICARGADGGADIDLLRHLRERRADVPAILVSPEPDGDLAATATRLGVTEYAPLSRLEADGETLDDRVAAVCERSDGGRAPDERTSGRGSDRDPSTVDFGAESTAVFDTLATFVGVLTPDGAVRYANRPALSFAGVDLSDVVGVPFWETPWWNHSATLRREVETNVERAAAGEQTRMNADHYNDETHVKVSVTFSPIYDGDEVVAVIVEGTDMTDLWRATVEREQTLGGLLTGSRDLQAADTPAEVADVVVESAVRLLDSELVGVRLYDAETDELQLASVTDAARERRDFPESYAPGEGAAGRAFDGGEPVVVRSPETPGVESAVYLPLGKYGTLGVGFETETFDDANVSVAELLAADAATALRRTERQQELRLYEGVLETVQQMVFVLDETGELALVTEPLAARLGGERESFVGADPRTLLAESVGDDDREALEFLRREEGTYTTTLVDAEGEPFPVEVELSALETPTGERRIVGVIRDVSELAETRERLRVERDRFRSFFEQLPDPINEVEFVDGIPVVRSVNPAFERTFDCDAAEVLGRSANEVVLPASEADAGAALDQRVLEEGAISAEVVRRTADGDRTFLFRGIPYAGGEGEWMRAFGVYTDISEQRMRERHLHVLHRVLRHNLRNDLNVIVGLTDQLTSADDAADRAAIGERLQERAIDVAEMAADARRLTSVIDRRGGPLEPVDVGEMVEALAASYAERHPEATFEMTVRGEPTALADEWLRIAVDQLVENAVEHNDAAEPRVVLEVVRRDDAVAVTVADNGPGVPQHERDVVTGDRVITQLDHGSGLGLWTAKWVAEIYGGDIEFGDRRDGDGTRVTLTVRAAD